MREIYDQVTAALKDRSGWEERQAIWYQMRHDGLRRRKKPYAGAADLHFPLIDTQIEKLKPFYYGQAFGATRLAEFLSMVPTSQGAEESAADKFDFEMRRKTNFEKELLHAIDAMLLSGRSVIKQRWDSKKQQLVFEAVDPSFVIVPGSACDCDEDIDWLCHVQHWSVETYKSAAFFKDDADTIARIRGGEHPGAEALQDDKLSREGITVTKDEDKIIVWEHWKKSERGYEVRTFSPNAPEIELRAKFVCPYKKQGEPFLPFTSFAFEIKDKGWYSPRGVAERQAAFESWMNKQWNGKADAMDFFNKPLFTRGSVASINTANLVFGPGSVLPDGWAPMQMPSPPISFDTELQQTHRIAQESLSMPDANIASMDATKDNPTAREISYRQALAGQGVDMRGRIFRWSLCRIYEQSWALMVQFSSRELAYFASGQRNTLPQQAWHDHYMVQPDGSADQWHREARFQRSVARYQMFRGHPNIDQVELAKGVIADDDARLVHRLVLPANIKTADESEDEALEILGLMAGFPMSAKPGEDHRLRIGIIMGKLQQLTATGAPVDPIARQRLQEHLAIHVQLLQQDNPQMAGQVRSAITDLDPQESAMPSQGAQMLGAPNVVPMETQSL